MLGAEYPRGLLSSRPNSRGPECPADPRGTYLSVSQSLPDNRVRNFTHTIIINSLIYSRISATLFLLKTPISSP